MFMQNKIELLAPAGRWDVLEAVISSGADAVYLGSKKFNMRLHRSDYHFTDEQMIKAVELAHKNDVKLYVTVNNLFTDSEIDDLYSFMNFLVEINVDAIIVQDLGLIRLVNRMEIDLPIHASTMMNTHSVPMAQELQKLGVSRIITSRDITISQAKEIHEKCNVEVEYFVHGDMCTAQSSQCYASGILFSKSGNRGECMKPCRWNYSLVDSTTGQSVGNVTDGHFLAMNDLCLLQHIPSLVEAGICSFKIEGRMRDAKYLSEVVSIYRRAIDSYMESPSFYFTNAEDLETIYKTRVRNLSTSICFSHSNNNTFDYSGNREPLFLSKFAKENELTVDDFKNNPFEWQSLQADLSPGHSHFQMGDCKTSAMRKDSSSNDIDNQTNENPPEKSDRKSLSIKIGSSAALKNAIVEGADYVYINADISPGKGQMWTLDQIKEAVEFTHSHGKHIGICTPRITTSREIADVKRLLKNIKEFEIDSVVVHNLGTLRLAREFGYKIFTDFSFNVLNTYAASLLNFSDVSMICASVESSFDFLIKLSNSSTTDIECIVHGQIPFMVLEHCIPAQVVTKSNANSVCRQPCRHMDYALRDEKGEVRPIEVDQYCRNHIFFASDLCLLPYLSSFMATNIKSFRIEAQHYDDNLVSTIVKLYRKQLDMFHKDPSAQDNITEADWSELTEKSPRKFGLGVYKHNIFKSKKTSEVLKSLV